MSAFFLCHAAHTRRNARLFVLFCWNARRLSAGISASSLTWETVADQSPPNRSVCQIDDAGHAILGGMIEDLGLKIHCNARVTEFLGDEAVTGLTFSNEGWEDLDVGMVVVSAGIRCVPFFAPSFQEESLRIPFSPKNARNSKTLQTSIFFRWLWTTPTAFGVPRNGPPPVLPRHFLRPLFPLCTLSRDPVADEIMSSLPINFPVLLVTMPVRTGLASWATRSQPSR